MNAHEHDAHGMDAHAHHEQHGDMGHSHEHHHEHAAADKHSGHDAHAGHGVMHEGHATLMRNRFFVSLPLTIIVLLYSPMV